MFKKTLIAAALVVATSASFAEGVYLQGSAGQGNLNVDFSGAVSSQKSSSGSKFVLGYEMGGAGSGSWSVEALAIDYGKASANYGSSVNDDIKVSGYGLGAAWTTALSEKWSFKGGLALMSNKAQEDVPAYKYSNSTTSSKLNLGFGFGYKINDMFSVVGEYDVSGVKNDLKGTASSSTGSVSLISIGLRAKF